MNWHKVNYSPTKSSVDPTINLPASKSIANRLLILQYLSNHSFEISNLSEANDTLILKSILSNKILQKEINCQDAGTVLRFMTSLCATQLDETFNLIGKNRLLQRPMKPLFDSLAALGARINITAESIQIEGQHLISKPLHIAGDVSSQFISGLCLIAPEIKNGLNLTISKPIYSEPYIRMTLQLMERLGIRNTFEKNRIHIPEQKIKGQDIKVEADWSSSCFFYAFLLLADDLKIIKIKDLSSDDIQGDKFIAELGEYFGIESKFNSNGIIITKNKKINPPSKIHLADYPDLAIPLITACAFKYPNITFSGLQHLKHKESNRIEALQKNLEKFGIMLKEKKGHISCQHVGKKSIRETVKIESFNDHRIAMSFVLVASLGHKIEIDNIDCIQKSFPTFFDEVSKLGMSVEN